MGPRQITWGLKGAETGIGINQRVEKHRDLPHPVQNPLDKALRFRTVAGSPLKNIFSALQQGKIDVQAVSAITRPELGEKRRIKAVPMAMAFTTV